MANLLNQFFGSVFTNENTDIPYKLTCNIKSNLSDVQFGANNVLGKIHGLRQASAMGPDKISTRLLQETGDILCVPFSIVFTRSLNEGKRVPDDWRKANVTPIFKKGSKMASGNYIPVSLTCIICKLMESIIRDRIVCHLVGNELILSSQHGFMASKSCQTNLLEYMNTLTKLVDEGYDVDILYLDFAKAFNKVPH